MNSTGRRNTLISDVGAAASVGSVADSYDNAVAEALNGSFKAELIEHHGPWRDADQVERAVVQWVGWYNTERLHSTLDYPHPRNSRPSTTVPRRHRTPPETHKIGLYETRFSSLAKRLGRIGPGRGGGPGRCGSAGSAVRASTARRHACSLSPSCLGTRRRVDVQQGARHGAGRHGQLQGTLLADVGVASVCEGGEGVAEVDVVLLLARTSAGCPTAPVRRAGS
ncbi:integrase core domain-containing protein [Streptomyces sp. P3]|uniref:integrase core domain-containing protein n=1 Tax=Streptomyces sp. P3 TaxID=2135430 RepID=UPI003465E917